MPPGMNIDLAYGQGSLSIDLPSDRTTVIEPSFASGLPEEKDTLLAALDQPIGLPAFANADRKDRYRHSCMTLPLDTAVAVAGCCSVAGFLVPAPLL